MVPAVEPGIAVTFHQTGLEEATGGETMGGSLDRSRSDCGPAILELGL